MKIKQVTVKNFKVLKDEQTFKMGCEDFMIEGENGIGKTTLGEAINWCMTGSSFYNNTKYTSKFKNNNAKKSDDLFVEMVVEHEGEEHYIRREDNPIKAYVDGYEVNSLTAELLSISEEAFLVMFNPRYFASLSPKDAKALLKKELKRVDTKKIYDEQMSDYEKEKMDGHTRINKKIENARSDIDAYDDSIIFLEGQLSKTELKEVPDREVFDKQEELDMFKEKLSNLKNYIPFEETPEIEKLKQEYQELQMRILTIEREMQLKIEEEINEKFSLKSYEEEKNSLVKKIELLENEVTTIAGKIEKKRLEFHEAKDDLRHNNREIEFLHETLNKNDNCPNCGYDLDTKEKNIAENKIKKLEKEVKTCNEKIKGNEKMLSQLNVEFDKKVNEIESMKAQLMEKIQESNSGENKVKEYRKKRQSEIKEDVKELNEELDEMDKKIKKLTKELSENIETQNEKLANHRTELSEKIEALINEKNRIENLNNEVEKIIEENEKITKERKEIKKRISDEKHIIMELKNKVKILKDFNSKIVQEQTKELNDRLKNVTINMVSFNKRTGELLNIFDVTYNNGTDIIDYDLCSFGEKQAIGIEIGDMISKQKDVEVPLFVDDAQSLTIQYETDRQVIKAKTKLPEPEKSEQNND